MTKKCFMCVPMRGRSDEEIQRECDRFGELLKAEGYELVYPTLADEEGNVFPAPETEQERVHDLGHVVCAISECDAVAFARGWHTANGCRIIHEICTAYHMPMIFPDEKPM